MSYCNVDSDLPFRPSADLGAIEADFGVHVCINAAECQNRTMSTPCSRPGNARQLSEPQQPSIDYTVCFMDMVHYFVVAGILPTQLLYINIPNVEQSDLLGVGMPSSNIITVSAGCGGWSAGCGTEAS